MYLRLSVQNNLLKNYKQASYNKRKTLEKFMRKEITKDKEFNIISRSIDNASKCKVTEVFEDSFSVEVPFTSKFETGESVELFAMTPKGQLYFETLIKEINNNVLTIWFPISHKYLQRREFSRIRTEKHVELALDNLKIKANVEDISAGGLKVKTKEQLRLLENYKAVINIENKAIETIFEPIRIETASDGFISSGRFKNLNNYDRITLVQYCFIKQIANSNK